MERIFREHSEIISGTNGSYWVCSKSTDPAHFKKVGDTLHISPEALTITWGNSERFWKKFDPPSGIFDFRSKELIQVKGLDVSGGLELSKYKLANKTYEVIFKIKFTDQAFGWDKPDIIFEVIGQYDVIGPDGKTKEKSVNLGKFPPNKVHEITAGEFTTNDSKGTLAFGMYEMEGLKGGLILEEVIVRPKSL